MPSDDSSNRRSVSTTWQWRRVKITGAPEPKAQRDPKDRSIYAVPVRDPRKPITITVVYRGGAEAWYQITARGATFRRPGHVCLHDIMRLVYGQS